MIVWALESLMKISCEQDVNIQNKSVIQLFAGKSSVLIKCFRIISTYFCDYNEFCKNLSHITYKNDCELPLNFYF